MSLEPLPQPLINAAQHARERTPVALSELSSYQPRYSSNNLTVVNLFIKSAGRSSLESAYDSTDRPAEVHASTARPRARSPSHCPRIPSRALSAIHADVGSAIVNLVERKHGRCVSTPMRAAEITRYGNHAVIVVTPGPTLRRLRGVQLVPVGDGRALISLAASTSISSLELQVRDALEQMKPQQPRPRGLRVGRRYSPAEQGTSRDFTSEASHHHRSRVKIGSERSS